MTKHSLTTAACLISLAFTANVSAKSSVWKVSKDDDYFYLGGTWHMLAPEDHPLPEEFVEAYADAQEIILETDVEGSQSPEFQQKMMAAMMSTDGRTLSDKLDAQIFDQLKTVMEDRGLPIEQFDMFEPWGVSLMVAVQEYYALGMVPEYGVDSYMHQLAMEDEKTVQSLETPEEQLGFLTSLSTIDPNVSIQYLLRDIENLPQMAQDMKQIWRTGELEQLENYELMVEMKEDFPLVYEALLTTRNNNWMKELVTLFDDNAIEVVLVGAAHLAGDDGLVNQLKNEGFDVEQLD